MDFLTLKSLHLIFVVTWFAGLFYIFRLFVYHAEAESKEPSEREILQRQYQLMEKRLWYIITWPSAILALTFGIWMLVNEPQFLKAPYMHVKLGFVALLMVYQIYGQKVVVRLQRNDVFFTGMKMRFLNEVSTIILISIVFIIIKKDALDWLYGVVGILGVAVLLTFSIKWYKRYRNKKY